jgi:hypothetical protein
MADEAAVFARTSRLPSGVGGEWNFTGSSRPRPSGVCTIAYSAQCVGKPSR